MTRVPNEAELPRRWRNHDFFPCTMVLEREREREAWVREKDPFPKIKSAKTYRKVENQRLSSLVSGARSAWVGCARERAEALYATGENKDWFMKRNWILFQRNPILDFLRCNFVKLKISLAMSRGGKISLFLSIAYIDKLHRPTWKTFSGR